MPSSHLRPNLAQSLVSLRAVVGLLKRMVEYTIKVEEEQFVHNLLHPVITGLASALARSAELKAVQQVGQTHSSRGAPNQLRHL